MSEEREQVLATEEKTRSGPVTFTRAAEEANRLIDKKYQECWAREKAGKPIAWVMNGAPLEILQCFDIIDVYPENYGAQCAIQKATSPFIEYAEEDGFSTNICGYLRIALGYARTIARGGSARDAAYGGMPRPTMLLSSSRLCDPRTKIFEALRRYLDVPVFNIDTQRPPNEDPRCTDSEACEHYIKHNAEGYKGLIRFLEGQTGKKMDWDRFKKVVQDSIEMWHLFSDVNELRKNIPCPMPSEDLFVVFWPFIMMPGEAEALQFYRNLHQEVKERISSGIPVIPEEKYRLLWLGQPAWFDMELFNYLESKGAVSVIESAFRPSRPREIDMSDPIRALAEKWFWGWDWAESDGSQISCGLSSGSRVLQMVKDYNIDGVIAHSTISCRAVSVGHTHIAKVLREQMGLPVLYIESDMTDPRSYSPTEEREKIDAFTEIMAGRK